MILISLQWVFISLLSYSLGKSLVSLLFFKDYENSEYPITYFLLGLSGINLLANIYSLFLPISSVFLVLPILIILFCRPELSLRSNLSLARGSLITILTLLALLLVSTETANVDEAGYYLPLVKWIEHYPAIPGSALFIARTGFNSGLHMLDAVFGCTELYAGGIYELNGLLFIWFNYCYLGALIRLVKGASEHILSDLILACAMIFPFSFLIDSMDTDYLAIMAGIVICASILRKKKYLATNFLIFHLLLIMFLVTVKPFAIMFAIWPGLLLLKKEALSRKTILAILACSVYLLPWLIRNVIMTGYLIFPLHYFDFFDFEWEMPKEMTIASYLIVEEYAKIQKIRLDYLLTGVQSLSLSQWFPTWLEYQKSTVLGWLSLFMIPSSLICCLCFLVKKKTGSLHSKLFVGIGATVLLLWFFNFPALRFGWAWLLLMSIVPLYYLTEKIILIRLRWIAITLLIPTSLSWTRLTIKQVQTIPQKIEQAIFPTTNLSPTNTTYTRSGQYDLRVAKDDYCRAVTPPCQPQKNPYKIVLRGRELKDGFRVD